ncbi:hypothetical protein Tco_1569312 [Tanacetum coccineum]
MITSLKEEKRRNEIVIEKDEIPKEKSEDMRSEIEIDLKSKLEFWKFEMLQELEMENKKKKIAQAKDERVRNQKENKFEKKTHGDYFRIKKLLEEEELTLANARNIERRIRITKKARLRKTISRISEDRDTKIVCWIFKNDETIHRKKETKMIR